MVENNRNLSNSKKLIEPSINSGPPKVKFDRQETESKMKKGQTLNLVKMERDASASVSPEKIKKEKAAKNAGG